MQNNNAESPIFDLQFDLTAKTHLLTIISWAKVVGIASLVSNGISILAALMGKDKMPQGVFSGAALSAINNSQSTLTIITSGISVLLAIFMLQFSNRVRHSIDTGDSSSMTNGWKALKLYFQVSALLSLVVIALILLGSIVILSTGALDDLIK